MDLLNACSCRYSRVCISFLIWHLLCFDTLDTVCVWLCLRRGHSPAWAYWMIKEEEEEEDADVPSVALSFHVHACQTPASNHAIAGWKAAGPEDPAHRLLSPGSRHPAPPFGATVICSRLHQNSSVLIEWLISNVVAVCCHLIYLKLPFFFLFFYKP